jgi:LDH2 family malate/lactate/ureidoglycolate dehydrogenase
MDGCNGFGHCVAEDAMDLASELAAQFGVGVVSVRRSNHFGAAAYFVNRAAERGELGFAFSNARARVAAYGGASQLFGTNPLSFGAPLRDRRPILVDLSTGASAMSSVRQAIAQNKPISPDLFVDDKGNSITDPSEVNSFSTMRPFGGARGYCLGLMVEVLSAVISQAALSTAIPDLREDVSRPSGVGHLFLAIRIEHLLPLDAYYATMDELVGSIQGSQPLPGFRRVDLPGDARWRAFDQNGIEGIPLRRSVVKHLAELARDLGVDVPWGPV